MKFPVLRKLLLLGGIGLLLAGCAGRKMVLEMSGSVMYEKPAIESIGHTLTDTRLEGGAVEVQVTLKGDPGLQATFDISPDIAHNEPLVETEPGRYSGRFSFPLELTGGPFSIIGRLRHHKAGEVSLKDPDSITIPLAIPRR